MNESSLVFSHQREIARGLAEQFEETTVITADEDTGSDLPGIRILSSRWKPSKRIVSILKFYRLALPFIQKNHSNLIVFSHMTEVQSFLIAPWCRMFGVPHFIWYAHASKSFFLYASYPLVNGIITSTSGSCPLKGKKVHVIGQAIEEAILKGEISGVRFPPLRWYHVGRIDPSKNIDLIISVFKQLRAEGWELTLDLYGAPSSEKSLGYFTALLKEIQDEDSLNWVSFRGPIRRDQLPSIASDHDGFVHAFQGSLDKTALEATLCKRIVVSINPEYMKEFSIQNDFNTNLEQTLFAHMLRALRASPDALNKALELNFKICKSRHTSERWFIEICKVLKNDKQ